MKNDYILLIVLTLVGLVSTAYAEEGEPTSSDAGVMEKPEVPCYETVVVANIKEEDPFLSDRSVCVVDQQDLAERMPRTIPEALWDTPGIFVQQTNHGGGSPIIRGMVGPQNLILVDGVRLNNSIYRPGPLQYLNMVDPLSISRIEVLRGAGSLLYGSDAMGGVIQLTPLDPRILESGELGGGGEALGRFATANFERTGHGHFDVSYEGAGLLGGITYKYFDDLRGGGDVGVQPYSGYDDLSAIGSFKYRFLKGDFKDWSVKAVYLGSRIGDAGRTDKLYDKHQLQFYDNEDDLVYARAHMEFREIQTDADFTLSYQHFFEAKSNISMRQDLDDRISSVRDDVTAHTMGLDLKLHTHLLDNRMHLRYGGMFYRDWVGAEKFSRSGDFDWFSAQPPAFPDGSTADNYGGFAKIEGDPVATSDGHVLRLGGGYRLSGMSGFAPEEGELQEVDYGFIGHVFLGSVQYIYKEDATVAFTFSQGYRAPNLNESVKLGDSGKYFHTPNSDLEPEKSDTFELLARGRIREFTIGAAGYVSLLHDLMKREETTWEDQSTINGKPVVWNVNGGEGILWGTEAELAVELGHGFSTSAHINYTWGEEYIDDGPDIPLTRIPPLFGQGTVRYDTPGSENAYGFIETYVRAAGDQDRLSEEDKKDARIPEGGTGGWVTLNLGGGVYLWDHLALLLRLENLLDTKYKYHGSGVYAPGINGILTMRVFY